MPRAKIISIINYKGGVGKTTSTYHIGCSLAQHYHKKVLLVDIDPQTNLTFLCASYDRWKQFKEEHGTIATLYRQYFARESINTRQVIWQKPINLRKGKNVPNLDLIPCDLNLLNSEFGSETFAYRTQTPSPWQMQDYLHSRHFLCEALRQVSMDYDYIIIDCPPNFYLLTQNALLASDAYLVTAIPDHLSAMGIFILEGLVKEISQRINNAQIFLGKTFGLDSIAEFGGVVFIKVKHAGQGIIAVQNAKMRQIQQETFGKCFADYTSELSGYSESAEQHMPVWECQTQNAKSASQKEEYLKITRTFLERFSHEQIKKISRA